MNLSGVRERMPLLLSGFRVAVQPKAEDNRQIKTEAMASVPERRVVTEGPVYDAVLAMKIYIYEEKVRSGTVTESDHLWARTTLKELESRQANK